MNPDGLLLPGAKSNEQGDQHDLSLVAAKWQLLGCVRAFIIHAKFSNRIRLANTDLSVYLFKYTLSFPEIG
jgi:hypothetical protein